MAGVGDVNAQLSVGLESEIALSGLAHCRLQLNGVYGDARVQGSEQAGDGTDAQTQAKGAKRRFDPETRRKLLP